MRAAATILAALTAAALAGGCVERKLTITSEPSGALVQVSDVTWGRTPVTRSFKWYGDYDIIARLDGYETVKTHRNLTPPAYEIPPLDLLSALAPWTYRDHRYVHLKLNELELTDEDVLIERAREMREETNRPVR